MTSNLPVVVSDTNVVSYIFNQDSRSLYYEERLRGSRQVISFQTLEEIRYGAYSNRWGARRMRDLLSYLEGYEVVWPNTDIVIVCASLRAESRAAGRELQVPDAWIAATALYLGCPLASHDSHFAGIPNLHLIRDPVL